MLRSVQLVLFVFHSARDSTAFAVTQNKILLMIETFYFCFKLISCIIFDK